MPQSFQLTAKLAEELIAMPEVLEAPAPLPSATQATAYVPESPVGTLATLNTAKVAGRAPSPVTNVAADSIPSLRIVANALGVQTMSSLDIVDYINHIRKPGEAILRHDHFMAKVPSLFHPPPHPS